MRSLIALAVTLAAGGSAARSVYLNGTDISSARSQELKGVDLVINEKGDIFIIAPHYQVNEEDTYVPLSKYVQGLNAPKHQQMQPLQKVQEAPPKPLVRDEVPVDAAVPGAPLPKAGAPVGQAGQPRPVNLVPPTPPGEAPEAPPVSEVPKMDDGTGGKEK